MIVQQISAVLTAMLISLVAQTAFGAGGENNYSSASQEPAGFNAAVALIAAEKYEESIILLQSAEKEGQNNADIQNLLGFVHRKMGKLDTAGSYYRRALEINPKHKVALEYEGELFLIRGDKDGANANLAKLNKICWLGCSEYDDLKKAIDDSQ